MDRKTIISSVISMTYNGFLFPPLSTLLNLCDFSISRVLRIMLHNNYTNVSLVCGHQPAENISAFSSTLFQVLYWCMETYKCNLQMEYSCSCVATQGASYLSPVTRSRRGPFISSWTFVKWSLNSPCDIRLINLMIK